MTRIRTTLALLAALVTLPGATWYMAPDADDGGLGDDANAGTSELVPVHTLAVAFGKMSAGDRLIVMDGVWDSTSCPIDVDFTKGGSAGALSYIVADTNAAPVFDASARYFSELPGYDAGGAAIGLTGASADYVTIRGIEFRDYPDSTWSGISGIITANATTANMFYVTIDDCKFTKVNRDSTCQPVYFDADVNGSALYDFYYCAVTNNYMDTGDEGIEVELFNVGLISGNAVIGHTGWDEDAAAEFANGITVNGGNLTTVTRNTITGFDHGLTIAFNVDQLQFTHNTIYTLNDDFFWSRENATDCTFAYNVCWDGGDNAFESRGARDVLEHNTFFDMKYAPIVLRTDSHGLICRNNVIAAPQSSTYFVYDYGDPTGYLFEGNLYWAGDGGSAYRWQLPTGTYNTFAAWQAAGYDSPSGVQDDPKFTDAAGGNFHPTSNSPALQAGEDGRTIGALPCAECWHTTLNLTGEEPDSVHVEVFDVDGSRNTFAFDDGVWGEGWTRYKDVDLDSTKAGQARARWSIYQDGSSDSLIAWDKVSIVAGGSGGASASDLWAYATREITGGVADTVAYVTYADSTRTTGDGGGGATAAEVWSYGTRETTGGTIDYVDSLRVVATASVSVDSVRAVGTVAQVTLVDSVDTPSGTPTTYTAYSSADSSTIAGVSIWLKEAGQLHDHGTTASNGTWVTAITQGASYSWQAWKAGAFSLGSGTHKELAAAGSYTKALYLDPITLATASDPDFCAVSVYATDWQATAIESVLVSVSYEGSAGYTDAGMMVPRELTGYTALDGEGNALVTFTLPRSSEITGDATTFAFTLSDGAASRVDNPYRSVSWYGVTIPDQASTSLRAALP